MSAGAMDNAVPSSSGQVLQFCFAFMFQKFLISLRRVALPLLVGGFGFYVFLSLYLSQLAAYLHHPVGSIGSRVLGVAAAGALVMLFLHSMIVSSVVEIVLGRQISDRNFLGIKKWQWGLYVANLKILLVAVLYASLFLTVRAFIGGADLPAIINVPLISIVASPLIWFIVRAWFFLLPVCLEVDEGEALTKSWRASEGRFWSVAAILVPILVVAAIFQSGGELFLHTLHLIGPLRSGTSLASDLILVQEYLKPIVVLISVCYFLAVLLTTSARMRAYERVVHQGLPNGRIRHEDLARRLARQGL
ncbi:MAG: hypothetical protein V4559_14915 [Pseudomonadota bacterium]